MKQKNRKKKLSFISRLFCRWVPFFLVMSFVITCCMLLFMNTMSKEMQIELSEAEIGRAAKVIFLNVLLLSLICTVIDVVQRSYTVERPMKRIAAAAERIMKGDLSARVEPLQGLPGSIGDFNEIIDYFNRMAKELSGIETLRTDFIINVSHELKTPLSIIQNYGTMLQSPSLKEEQRFEYAKTITDASRRLSKLISNILKLNKLENQQIFPLKETYDLGEQLCECLLSFENVWEMKKLEIDTDIEENVYVETDSELLSLVWNNLFSNAIKFTGEGGSVFLRLKTNDDMAVVEITDTGCGISKEVGQHIFEKFYQGDISHSMQGNGLGLALVKRVVDIVDSDISVESEVGKGSTFTVKIKRKKSL